MEQSSMLGAAKGKGKAKGKSAQGKGSAPPPPPPTMPNTMGLSGASSAGPVMRQLATEKIAAAQIRPGAIWQLTAHSGASPLPGADGAAEVVELFKANTATTQKKKRTGHQGAIPMREETLVDKAQDVEIVMMKLKARRRTASGGNNVEADIAGIIDSVLAFDSTAMDAQYGFEPGTAMALVRRLYEWHPEPRVLRQLVEYRGDPKRLMTADLLYKRLGEQTAGCPDGGMQQAMECFVLCSEDSVGLERVANVVADMHAAADEVLESSRLQVVFAEALRLSNAINDCRRNGNAVGLTVPSLIKLADVKTNKTALTGMAELTAMQYLARQLCATDSRWLQRFQAELPHLEMAAGISFSDVRVELARLRDNVVTCCTVLDSGALRDRVEPSTFCDRLRIFLDRHEPALGDLEADYAELLDKCDQLCVYLCDSTPRGQRPATFASLHDFLRAIIAADLSNKATVARVDGADIPTDPMPDLPTAAMRAAKRRKNRAHANTGDKRLQNDCTDTKSSTASTAYVDYARSRTILQQQFGDHPAGVDPLPQHGQDISAPPQHPSMQQDESTQHQQGVHELRHSICEALDRILESEPEPERTSSRPELKQTRAEGIDELSALLDLLPALSCHGLAQLLKAGLQVDLDLDYDDVNEEVVREALASAGCSSRKGQRRVARHVLTPAHSLIVSSHVQLHWPHSITRAVSLSRSVRFLLAEVSTLAANKRTTKRLAKRLLPIGFSAPQIKVVVQSFEWRERKLESLKKDTADTSGTHTDGVPADLVKRLFCEEDTLADSVGLWREHEVAAARTARLSVSLEEMLDEMDQQMDQRSAGSLRAIRTDSSTETEANVVAQSASHQEPSASTQSVASAPSPREDHLNNDSDGFGSDDSCEVDTATLRLTTAELQRVTQTEIAEGRPPHLIYTKQNWVPNSARTNCMRCPQRFSFFHRRHHCRRCGHLLCAACSSNRVVITDSGSRKAQRVCSRCLENLMQTVA